MQNTSICISASMVLNHSTGVFQEVLKKVPDTTSRKSPKKPPNISPQNMVENPQYRNSSTELCMPGDMFLNRIRANAHTHTMIMP